LRRVKLACLTLIFLMACSNPFTPTGVVQQGVVYSVRKGGARHSEFIYQVDTTITETQRFLWGSARDAVFPSDPPEPPTDMPDTPPPPIIAKKIGFRHVSYPSCETLAYQQAMELLRKGDFKEAFPKFTLFADLYPDSDLADNALYWAGECCYVQNLKGEALHFFKKVVSEYPMSNKVPDAMLKTALLYISMGERERGLHMLQTLINDFPSRPAVVGIARARLEKERWASVTH